MDQQHRKEESLQSERQNERGALYVEGILSLSFFMFAIFTLLSVIQIAYTQARMGVALDCATKELAEYTHIFFATGLADTFDGEDGASSELFDQLSSFLNNIGSSAGLISSDLEEFITEAADALEGDSISAMLETLIGQKIARKLMEKNMVSGLDDTAEAFQQRNHIVSIDMNGSKFLEGSNDVFLQVNYDIQVVQLFNIDIVLHMSHCAYAQAWGNGE